MKKGFHANIEKLTLGNQDFRRVLYTASHSQLVVMSLQPGEEIGVEVHSGNDQFFRFEQGQGQVIINDTEYMVSAGDAIVVPAGARHNVINAAASEALKFYTLYAPAHHQDGVIRNTKAAAASDAPEFDGTTTE